MALLSVGALAIGPTVSRTLLPGGGFGSVAPDAGPSGDSEALAAAVRPCQTDAALDHSRHPRDGVMLAGALPAPPHTMQFAIEANIPANRRTGGGTGVLLQLHFFLDDLFPSGLGKPLIGP